MKTSTAEKNNYVCPRCNDDLTEDHAGLGFVRHKTNPDCDFEKRERDANPRIKP